MAKAAAKQSQPKPSAASSLGGELVLGSLLAELFGVFALTTCLLHFQVVGNPFIAAITVIVLVMVLSRVSGSHINPAVTIGLWATKQISAVKGAGYIIAQVLGAMLALVVVTQFTNATPADQATGQTLGVFAIQALADGQTWRPFFGEALGSLILGFGVAAAVLGRKNSMESGFIVGGSLLLGLIIATFGSAGILNPAVALGLSAYHADNIWTTLVYGLSPILGVVAGAWLYKLLQWDVTGSKELDS